MRAEQSSLTHAGLWTRKDFAMDYCGLPAVRTPWQWVYDGLAECVLARMGQVILALE